MKLVGVRGRSGHLFKAGRNAINKPYKHHDGPYYQVSWLAGANRLRIPDTERHVTSDCDAYNWAAYEMLLLGVTHWQLHERYEEWDTGDIGMSCQVREVCKIPYRGL